MEILGSGGGVEGIGIVFRKSRMEIGREIGEGGGWCLFFRAGVLYIFLD